MSQAAGAKRLFVRAIPVAHRTVVRALGLWYAAFFAEAPNARLPPSLQDLFEWLQVVSRIAGPSTPTHRSLSQRLTAYHSLSQPITAKCIDVQALFQNCIFHYQNGAAQLGWMVTFILALALEVKAVLVLAVIAGQEGDHHPWMAHRDKMKAE